MDKRRLGKHRKCLIGKQAELTRLVSKSKQDDREAHKEATQDVADKAADTYTKEFLSYQSDDNQQILNLVNKAL